MLPIIRNVIRTRDDAFLPSIAELARCKAKAYASEFRTDDVRDFILLFKSYVRPTREF